MVIVSDSSYAKVSYKRVKSGGGEEAGERWYRSNCRAHRAAGYCSYMINAKRNNRAKYIS